MLSKWLQVLRGKSVTAAKKKAVEMIESKIKGELELVRRELELTRDLRGLSAPNVDNQLKEN